METLLVKNTRLVNEGAIRDTDILIRDGRFEKIAPGISPPLNARIVDAEGQFALPGVIDDQVHFREPGLTRKGEIATESRAAVVGGVTSFMEMPNVDPATTTRDALRRKYERAAEVSLANYAFYLGATNDNIDEIKRLGVGEACGVKVFMGASTGSLLVDDPQALERIFAEAPTLIATHCEDNATIRANLERLEAENPGGLSPGDHPRVRSAEACYLSSSLAVSLARRHDARLHVLHLTTAREMELFERGPAAGKRVTAEVCVHHLHFTDADYVRLGNRIKCNPAIKSGADRAALRAALRDDRIDVVATDHAPHLLEEKEVPYVQAAAGLPLVQHSLLMLLALQREGLLTLEDVARKTSHAVADSYRLVERGYVREGYWADLTLIDPDRTTEVTRESLRYKCGWSPLEGCRFPGAVRATVVSGQLVWLDGELFDQTRGQRLAFGAQR